MASTADAMLLGADLALTTAAAKQPWDATQFRSANTRYLPDQGSSYQNSITWTTKDIVGQVKDFSTAYLDIGLVAKSSTSTAYTASAGPVIRGWLGSVVDRLQVKSNQSGSSFVDGQANDTFLGSWLNLIQNLDVESLKVDAPEVHYAIDDLNATGLTKRQAYWLNDFAFDTASASFVGRLRLPLRYLDSYFATQTLSFGVSHDIVLYHNLSSTAQSSPFYCPSGVAAPTVSIGTGIGVSGVQSPGQCYLVYRGIELNVAQQEMFNKSLSVPRTQRYLTMRAYNPLLNQTGTAISANITTTLSHPSVLYIFAVPSGQMTSPTTNGPFQITSRIYNLQVSLNNQRLFEQPLGQSLAPGANGGSSYRDYELYREFKDAAQWSAMHATGVIDFHTWENYCRVIAIPLFRQQVNRNVEANQSLDVTFNVQMPAGVTSLDYYWVVSKERVATYQYTNGAVSVNLSQ